jgi:AraC-like DNA-binding protein
VQQSDLSINQILRNTAFAQLEDLTATSGTFLAKLEKVIKTRLGHGPLALKEVARDMGMSTRTLQARLDRYGMTFRQLLDGVRHAQAKHALRNTDLPLTEIAFSLGFTTQTSFQHAFKRWTGTSPGSFRRSRSSPTGMPAHHQRSVVATKGKSVGHDRVHMGAQGPA